MNINEELKQQMIERACKTIWRSWNAPHHTESFKKQMRKLIGEGLMAALDGLDECKFCYGIKGGVPGNCNVFNGILVCDYCTSLLLDIKNSNSASS